MNVAMAPSQSASLEDVSLMFVFFSKQAMENFVLEKCYSKSCANKRNAGNAHISQFPGAT